MSEKTVHTVRFEPVGVEMEVEEGEWLLDAAFRQGIAVPHGCREGQCSSCKCLLIEGDTIEATGPRCATSRRIPTPGAALRRDGLIVSLRS